MFDSVIGFTAGLITALAEPLDSTALAIVVFTLGVRLLLLPLGVMQARGERARARLAPEVRKLRERYARQPERLHSELSALYAREKTSPLAGCLPGMAQLPFFTVMYQVFVSSTIAGHANALLTHGLFGVQLGQQFAGTVAGFGLISGPALVFAGLFLLLAAVATITSRRMRRTMGEEVQPALRRVLPLLPYGTVLAAAVLPLAAGIYLLVTTAWTAAERAVLHRPALTAR
ncbi:YidC/Oxa1 family membrane protein insertase [Streptosporangium becharense]|uniref:Membrane protein insertase YidC n=1 Tax=Streptosporangium becharense TaxID=1816182 RepID=A0A7W9IHF7_9ACTN|nr:membrane protein insertase YidC [Streptosporangium becharense]MBB2908789.1 YidC/Oxa1 family membrane protein insertase [Streptosporangium becharense]MBB5820193.1 YidC/Oxa1 family membrane protein insertase [Streptosporangium becharense]